MCPPQKKKICCKSSLGKREKAKFQDENREHHGDGGVEWQGSRERMLRAGWISFTKLVTTKAGLSPLQGKEGLSSTCSKQQCSYRAPASVLLPSSPII